MGHRGVLQGVFKSMFKGDLDEDLADDMGVDLEVDSKGDFRGDRNLEGWQGTCCQIQVRKGPGQVWLMSVSVYSSTLIL